MKKNERGGVQSRERKNRCCYLESRVHFQEVKVLLGVHEELHSSSGGVLHSLSQSHSLLSHRSASLLVQKNATNTQTLSCKASGDLLWAYTKLLHRSFCTSLGVSRHMLSCVTSFTNPTSSFKEHFIFSHYPTTSFLKYMTNLHLVNWTYILGVASS